MTAYLSVEELRGFIPDTALEDGRLEDLLEEAADAIDHWAGALVVGDYDEPTERVETFHAAGRNLIRLLSEPLSISSVEDDWSGSTTALEATDYQLTGRNLRRSYGGSWGTETTVTYVPRNDRNTRRLASVLLVGLAINYQPGFASQQAGPWLESFSGISFPVTRQDVLELVRPADLFA